MGKGTSQALQEKIRATNARIDSLAERDREISALVGAAIADGGEVAALRDERREVRDLIEDLTAALPHLERQLEAAHAEDTRAEFRAWVETENAQLARAAEIGRELRPHIDTIRALVPELAALVGEHRTMTRLKVNYLAKASGERRPETPDLTGAAGLSPNLLDTVLPEFIRAIEQHAALHPEVVAGVAS